MRQCQICGKGSIMRAGRKKLRGQYNPTPKKRKYPNLQKTKLTSGSDAGKTVLVCAKCLKTLSKKG
ncbi:50S ribosomal protein L28 [Candidatus Wolfebacteria bacterium]|nr:50S ribosomal protein L28 [Candidatus Wolfebacteria bacterium]